MALSNDTTFDAGLDTGDGSLLGARSTSKIGFFGATPVVKNATPFDLSTGTVAELAAILAAYGLITTQA